MKRIHIIGPGGSGKTTLAAELASALGLPHIELDAVHWEENWQEPPREIFRKKVARALSGDAWVTDGNYSKVRDIVWQRAELVVWLDFPLYITLPRLLQRTIRRIFDRELLWGTNRETFRDAFFSKDSLFIYVIKAHQRHRKRNTALMKLPQYQSIDFVVLRSPRQVQRWVERFTSSPGSPAG